MNLESKDAIQNLILLLVFVMCGLMFFMLIIYAGLSLNMGVEKSIESIKEGHSLSNLFKKDGLLTVQILSQICCMIIPAFLMIKFNSGVHKMINNSKFNWNFLWLCILLLIVSLPFMNLLAYFNENIPLNEWMNSKETEINEMIKQLLDMHGIKDLVICLIAIAIIPAISEELIFRGILQNQLIRLFQNKWIGLIVGALLFSSIHLQFEGFLVRFAIGILLGFVYLYGGNLKYTMLLHFIFNGTQVLFVFISGVEVLDVKEKMNDNLGILTIGAIASMLLVYPLIRKITMFHKKEYA